MRKIGIEDIDDIALGSSLLGSGGGGDPYMGRLEAIAAVKKYGPVELLDIDEVPDTWTVAPICGVGAPSVSLEKGTNGVEYPKVRAMMERMLGRKLDAFLLSEAGGMNSMVPISAAARAGLPLINADGMGRAFPGIQQDTFTLNGVSTNPFIIADEKGNCTVLTTINNDWTEEIGREITTACGGQVTTLASPMSGEKMKTSVVVGTVDYAQKLGRIARHKAKICRKAEPAAAVLEYVARALGCVMRRRKRHNVHIPDPEALTAVEYVQTVGVLRILFLESLGCAASGKHRRLRFFKKHRQSLHMVDVLMRQHHRRNILQRERQCLQRSRNPAQRHTEIDQDRGAVRHI